MGCLVLRRSPSILCIVCVWATVSPGVVVVCLFWVASHKSTHLSSVHSPSVDLCGGYQQVEPSAIVMFDVRLTFLLPVHSWKPISPFSSLLSPSLTTIIFHL